jgi:hypothetical protein
MHIKKWENSKECHQKMRTHWPMGGMEEGKMRFSKTNFLIFIIFLKIFL